MSNLSSVKIKKAAEEIRELVERAEKSGLKIDDSNVMDLCLDNIGWLSFADMRTALVAAGLGARFPNSTAPK